jgi:hypothetical protein
MIIKNEIQSVKLSNEISKNKLIPEIIKFIRNIKEIIDSEKYEDIIVSIKYGKRIIINCDKTDFEKINSYDFIEIVDYDPLKNIILYIGPNKPDFNNTLHWIIQNARREINILVQIKNKKIDEIEDKKQQYKKKNSIEISKDILIQFRSNNIAYNKEKGIFIIGNNLNEMNTIINKLIEEK